MEVDLESYLSKDAGTEGFDLQAGETWIYPTNYPMREYQFRIVQEALYQNTLVSLPTGLGKTFIAAVVMYNFYRWYPTGKIIFMAPTRPLVKQQIDACYDIMAIPQNATAELTGTKAQTSREDIWKSKRVFFVTPQVLQNDITTFPELGKQIKCLIFDEAHKARGNHAYCEVIRKLMVLSKYFRVLALSATPGNSTNDIIDVSMSLLISHLEVRTEDSPDVAPYVFHRSIETVVVPLGGKLEEIRLKYLRVLEKYVRVLKDHKIIAGNCANLTKGKIFMTLKDFNHRSQHHKHPNHGDIARTLNICITLYHGYELLIRHGMRGFLNFFEEHSEKALLRGNGQLFDIMEEIQQYIGPRPDIALLPDGTIPQIADNSKFGHPKFYKLRNIVLEYFSNVENNNSKVIIFSEFKETVMEAYAILMQHVPVVKPKYFMGQGAITQKQQISIIKSFKDGQCNTLISTCIGEEGLDIGEVDLIICFDISNKSPIRLVQRMGRTGRKKQGKVIILVTEGKEQELLKDSLASRNYLSTHILKSHEIPKNLYKDNPRMIPNGVFPSCEKIHISVLQRVTTKSKSGNIKDMFNNLARSEPSISQVLSDVEIVETEERIAGPELLWNQSEPFSEPLDDIPVKSCGYAKFLDSLRAHQPTEKIGHSADTEILVSLLQFSDAKRYNLPLTQRQVSSQASNKKRKITKSDSSDNFKQTDIRNMFNRPTSISLDIASEDLSQTRTQHNVSKKRIETITNDLLTEISSYMIICYTECKICHFCEKTSLCNRLQKPEFVDVNLMDWVQLDMDTIEQLTENDFDTFLDNLTKESGKLLNDADFVAMNNMMDMEDESFCFDETPKKVSVYSFEAPESIKKAIGNSELSINVSDFDQIMEDNINTTKIRQGITKSDEEVLINMSETSLHPAGKVDDNIRWSGEDQVKLEDSFRNVLIKYDTLLQFLKLCSLEELFNEADEPVICNESLDIFMESPISPKVQIQSPDSSPTLCSSKTIVSNSNFCRKLEWNSITEVKLDNLKEHTQEKSLIFEQQDKKTPQVMDKTNLKSKLLTAGKSSFYVPKDKRKDDQTETKVVDSTKQLLGVDDICDLSVFGILNENIDSIQTNMLDAIQNDNSNCSEDLFASPPDNATKSTVNLSVADICDGSFFGTGEDFNINNIGPADKKIMELRNNPVVKKQNDVTVESPINKNKEESIIVPRNNTQQSNNELSMEDMCDLSVFGLSQILHSGKSSSETIVSSGNILSKKETVSIKIGTVAEKHHYIDLTESPLTEINETPPRTPSNDSDGPQSPVLSYTRRNVTQRRTCKKTLFARKDTLNKSPQLLLDDLCNSSVFDIDMPMPESTERQQLSPVLSQKFVKPIFLKSKLQMRLVSDTKETVKQKINCTSTTSTKNQNANLKLDNSDICDLSAFGFDTHENLTSKLHETSGVTVTQVLNLINTPIKEQKTDKTQKPKSTQKAKLNESYLHLLEDDYAFEDLPVLKTPTKTPSAKQKSLGKTPKSSTKKRGAIKVHFSNSDDDFEESRIPCSSTKRLPLSMPCRKLQVGIMNSTSTVEINKKKRKKKTKNPFIDDEAVVSSDEYATDETLSEGGCSQDVLEMSFVNDGDVANTTAMHVKYLQSVRSPLRKVGGFKIPERPTRNIVDVFSQKENFDDNTYLEDSFCVDIEDSAITCTNELSELDIAERQLEERRKQKHKSKAVESVKKKRRVIMISSDSE